MDVKGQTREGKPAVMPTGTSAPAPLLDVVYVVRPGEHNDNLRYSLRSLVNLPHARVYIAGYKPEWVSNVHYLPTEQANRPDQENSNANLLAAAESDVSSEFIFFNDDFMVMRPVSEIRPQHQGSLDARIAGYKTNNRMLQAFSLIATRDYLRQLIPEKPLYSYELHMPMVFDKHKLAAAYDLWTASGHPLLSLRPRSFYGNLYQIEGEQTADAKDTSWQESQTKEFHSTVGRSADPATGAGDELRARFNAACIYEAADS